MTFRGAFCALALFSTCAPAMAQSTTDAIRSYIQGSLPGLGVVEDAHAEAIHPAPNYYATMPGYTSSNFPTGSQDIEGQ